MNWLDIIIAIVLLIGLWKGYMNGLFTEIASLLALAAAIYGSIYFSNYAGDWLRQQFDWDNGYITILSFVVTFLAIIIAISIIGKVITKIINTAQLGLLNKIAGAAFGGAKMAFLCSVILMFVNTASGEFDLLSSSTKTQSILYDKIEPMAPLLLPKLLEEANKVDDRLRPENNE